jgi:hypothetical protein
VALARYVVGIDLGTTNSSVAYVDTGAEGDPVVHHLPIPQVVQAGTVEPRPLLPSFLYLPGPGEQPAGTLKLPWAADRDFAVGEFARNFGSQVPTRLVSSAKSWLSHSGVDRRAEILPWKRTRGSQEGTRCQQLPAGPAPDRRRDAERSPPLSRARQNTRSEAPTRPDQAPSVRVRRSKTHGRRRRWPESP